ncbi:MAG: serine hydrolase domain-containing protein [Cyclobacteriaceae bacterium]
MIKFTKLTALVFLIAACTTEKPQTSKFSTEGNPNYQPPTFTDSDRVSKMADAFPIIDEIYKAYATQNNFPSITYGLVADGKLIHSGSHGLSNIEANRTADTKALYRIASMSKSFTAMAILKLRDEGELQLQDPAAKYLPELGIVTYLTNDSAPITIQQLLTMSAGFPEDNPWGDRQLDDSDQELLDFIGTGLSFSNAPGLEYEYSNLGFAMLGNIIKNVSGTSYQQYITSNILQPLGMMDSKWEYTEIPDDRLALGYHWINNEWQPEPILNDGAFGAMGGLICSIEDFSKYVSLHLDAWPPRNDPDTGPVKRSTIREMHQLWRVNPSVPTQDEYGPLVYGYAYGLGWRKDARGIIRISHSGGLPGYGSEWRIYPDYGIGVVSFSNRRYGAPSSANAKVLDTLLAIANLKPRVLPVSEILTQRKSELLALFPYWDDQSKIFAENFYLDKTLTLRKKEIQDVFDQAGKILTVGELFPENQLRGRFTITCENENVEVFFTLTPEREPLIQQLNIRTSGN